MTESNFQIHRLPAALSSRCTRAIFLDFDGVLHQPRAIAGAKPPLTPQEIQAGWPQTFCHLGLLKSLLEGHSDIAVIVSSSWRLFLTDVELGELLAPIEHWYGGSTGDRRLGRDAAIKEWLVVNGITNYLVLDDVKTFFPGDWPQLLLCNSALGLSDPLVYSKLKQWINPGLEDDAETSPLCSETVVAPVLSTAG